MLDTPAGGQKWRGASNSRIRGAPPQKRQYGVNSLRDFRIKQSGKRTLRSLTEVYQVATINPWSDTAITFNASDEPKFRTAQAPAAMVLSPIVDGFQLTKVLMDGGIGLNLIYEDTLKKWK